MMVGVKNLSPEEYANAKAGLLRGDPPDTWQKKPPIVRMHASELDRRGYELARANFLKE